MSTRVIYRRGRRVEIEQLDDVMAMRTAEVPSDEPLADVTPPSVVADVAQAPLVPHDVNAFRRAGWMLVPAAQADAIETAGAARETPPARVYRDPQQGRLMIGTNRLTVKFKDGVAKADARTGLEQAGLTILRDLGFAKNLFEVEVGAGRDPLELSVELQQRDDVDYAEPEMIEHLPSRARPSDPQYARQWQWNNDGSLGGKKSADVRAELAWDLTRGAGVRVAVIDNGFDVEHPDLTPAISGGTAFFRKKPNGDAELQRTLVGYPDANHGTFCAGMVGARADNAEGGCGAAAEAELLLVACLPDQVGTQVTLARAVAYAASPQLEPAGDGIRGADIIACSLGPNNAPWPIASVLDDALRFAATEGRGGLGVPIFWAVDNAPNPVANDEVCSHEHTIAVGRSTRSDRENGSAFGPDLDFLAPGVEVFSTESGGAYGISTGTSFAAPCAAGVAALALAARSQATAAEVRRLMRDTCDQIGGVTYTNGHHPKYGHGRVNAARAVQQAVGMADDEAAVAAPQEDEAAGPPPVGPQLPRESGEGEYRWTAPATLRVRLPDGTERDLDVSVIDGRAVFEGDIVLTRGLETLGIGHSDVGRRWPGGTVVYDIDPALPNPKRVMDAIAEWQRHTMVTFKQRQTEKDYVYFRPGHTCSSAVGRIGGVQFVTLSTACLTGNVIHEIGHAVGLWHEQSREDRDQHVTIRWENINPAAHHNFLQQIQDGDDINEYDYASIMHYSARAFSINGFDTIIPRQAVEIGQRAALSAGDIKAVVQMYRNV